MNLKNISEENSTLSSFTTVNSSGKSMMSTRHYPALFAILGFTMITGISTSPVLAASSKVTIKNTQQAAKKTNQIVGKTCKVNSLISNQEINSKLKKANLGLNQICDVREQLKGK